ncbi:hypothetical protein [Saccharothrix sp. ST-888]|uniref:hypothetical protein n=1 Tax=Saccharothrix sp. ST-888 TaxID=1427391 RepID=UPI000A69B03A|nr:hypothetical protein [Saccharothrix sp. ST-888]
MGIRLIVEVMNHAPSTLTHREAWVLAVLAEDANDTTRACWPGIEDDPRTVHRMRLPGRSSRYEVLKALRMKGALEVVESGRRGHRAVYRIPLLSGAGENEQGPGNPDATHELGPENPDATAPTGSGKPGPNPSRKGPGNPDATRELGPDFTPIASGKPGPLPLNPLSSRSTNTSAAFDAFWAAYPRRVGKGTAKTAWAKAIKRGADPAHLTEAAQKHAAFWRTAGTDPKFIPHPTTWLNGERYDDELTTPQPPAPHQSQQQSYQDRGIF